MKFACALLCLSLAGILTAAGCPKSASTDSKPAPSSSAAPAPTPPPSQSAPPPPKVEQPSAPAAGQAKPSDQPKQPDQSPKEPDVAKAPVTTPGGVEIEDLVVGTGAECKPHQTVKFFYKGTLKSNGQEFQSNFGGDPIEYPLDQLIGGWQEGIPGMKVGGKRKLTIPYKLGYGEQGRPPTIPAKADLVFEIELVGVR